MTEEEQVASLRSGIRAFLEALPRIGVEPLTSIEIDVYLDAAGSLAALSERYVRLVDMARISGGWEYEGDEAKVQLALGGALKVPEVFEFMHGLRSDGAPDTFNEHDYALAKRLGPELGEPITASGSVVLARIRRFFPLLTRSSE